MIQYALKCEHGHGFDSWFQSAAAFDSLAKAGRLSCVECGSSAVAKAVMAPRVNLPAETGTAPPPSPDEARRRRAQLAALRKQVEENSDYVGPRFAQEARDMYLGTTPERSIYGEANLDEAKALIEDGIPVAPLPFVPNRKAN